MEIEAPRKRKVVKSEEDLLRDVEQINSLKQNLLFVMGRLNYLDKIQLLTEAKEIWKTLIDELDEVIVHHLNKEHIKPIAEASLVGQRMMKPISNSMLETFTKGPKMPGANVVEEALDEIQYVREDIVTLYEYYMDGDTFFKDFATILSYIREVSNKLEKL